MPATPIATSTSPVAPRPAEGVGDDDADVDAEQLAQPDAQSRGPRRPGRRAAARPSPGAVLDGVDPGRREHEAVPGLDDPWCRAARSATTRYGLRVDRLLAVDAGSAAPSALVTILRRDHQDVAVGERDVLGGGDQGRQVVAGATSGIPSTPRLTGYALIAADLGARSQSSAGHRAAAVSTSRISSGTARQRMPAASTRCHRVGVAVSTSQPSSSVGAP